MKKIFSGDVSRRTILKTTATAALVTAVRTAFPSGAFAATAEPEVKGAKIGFIALTDAAPLIIAAEKGLFAKHGMPDVEVLKQASWGATRDNLVLGGASNGIDGAHILTPMPYLMHTGKVTQNNVPVPMALIARLNLDSQGISVAKEYAETGVQLDASKLKAAFEKKKAEGKEIKAAMTFPGGTHDLWIRYWLAAGGIDPDKDVSTIVVPPPQMVANMKVGNMDVFCVGEPWNEQLVNQGIGFTACTTGELWKGHPEKALGMRADWVEKNPNATKALLMAVMEAQQWCDEMANKEEMSTILGKRQWFNVPPKDVLGRLKGNINYGNGRVLENTGLQMKFWQDHASYPFRSHDSWFITENIRWGKFAPDTDVKALVAKVNREDIWRDAAKDLGVADIPASTSRGKETFFDGKVFDPENPSAYLESLSIKAAS
ncbi:MULTISPECIES: CmpA/NrtA family ABC transporter substrate-binding protein [Rhizobium/Agrobacterium group]|jgi:nitrate/nitrite transport system substrate-binding protein|uniref:CmpA/NrtA family ABC transporter substrate-binding protein n=1 Tax=Rhizobium/Agrobacterium group TaxID=227290 RepID=UPI0003819602|nr:MULTISPECIES: CmpA/NrtA family ABC transporter substrate-binding protein [Rhizobium/Agrobacterium group]MDP9563833.1 nitrate/nitrite transport system substrate-binding protein [Rhizobium nepotum]MBO9110883.1 ABC transporter substrate-binding protein [Agrobacterium sp. S2/73]MDH7809882.1 nitrate/nitrite transport system substrate-binding protein [Rhizobium sp. AN67]MQB06597.1 nitrate ABC transporter substrate-binding protein [Agrobacterium tumefaciens]NSY08689.1 ABC transporter substrate-bin